MPKVRLAAALAFVVIAASRANSQEGPNAQAPLEPKEVAAAIRQAAERAVVKSGVPREPVEKKIDEKTREILADPDVDPKRGKGVSQKELDNAVGFIDLLPDYITISKQVERAPNNRRLAEKFERLKAREEGARAGSGAALKSILPSLDRFGPHPSAGGGPVSGGFLGGLAPVNPAAAGGGATTNSDDGLFGPTLPNLMKGGVDYGAGQFQAALDDYAQALRTEPKNTAALSGSASAEFHLKDYDAAYQFAQKTLALDPNDQNAVAVLHLSADRISAAAAPSASGPALAEAAAASSARADGAGTADVVAALSAAAARSPAVVLSIREADAANAIGDFAAARAAVDRGLAAQPHDPGLLARRADLEARSGDWPHSLLDARNALARDPKNMALLRVQALAQLRTKDYAGAIATANEMLELDARSADAYALRGQAYGLLGDKDLMAADLAAAAALNPIYRSFADAAKAGTLVKPADSDMMFLMPGERAASPNEAAPSAADRAGRFGFVVAAAATGGLLIALGILWAVKEKAKTAFARLARAGPLLGQFEGSTGAASAGAPRLIRGQYELSREIGAGGMGRVYEGTDRSLGRRVAIKKMRDELRDDARARARFMAEARTVAALHHPNIVDIYAIVEDGSDVYLVFEHVDGKTVHELVAEAGRLDPAATARVVRAAAEALEFAHAHGVIHRDVKPSNLMIDASGVLKVMDFGIARAAEDALNASPMTNSVIGTPPYMAPEQEQGQILRESDVYALAVCAYEMLTGVLPFAGVGSGIALNKIKMTFPRPSSAGLGLPPALDAVFAGAFQAEPALRTRTPRAFAAAFDAALAVTARV